MPDQIDLAPVGVGRSAQNDEMGAGIIGDELGRTGRDEILIA
jgi:hypothetical protein